MEWLAQTHLLLQQRQLDEAFTLLRSVADYENAEFQVVLANVLALSGHGRQAAVHYTRALELDPSQLEARLGLATCGVGSLEELVAACGQLPFLTPQVIELLEKRGDMAGAAALRERDASSHRYPLAQYHFALGSPEKGLEHCLAAPGLPSLDVEFYRELAPSLTISEGLRFGSGGEASASWDGLIRSEGYLQLDDWLPVAMVARVREGVERLHARGLPPVLIAVYDEVWALLARMEPVLRTALGEGYRQLPGFWAWFVPPGGRGWEPHLDRGGDPLRADARSNTLNVWVPLTDTGPMNGCMYVVPACDDPSYRLPPDRREVAVHAARALPVRAGSVLCWNGQVHHWGGTSSVRASGPRLSFANDYQRGDVSPREHPLLDPLAPPDFSGRLALAGFAVLRYSHMYG